MPSTTSAPTSPPRRARRAGSSSTAAKQGSRKLLAPIIGAAALIIAIVVLTAFVVPGWATYKTLSQTAVQDGVAQVLSKNPALRDIKDVRCPSGKRAEAGVVFTCQVNVNGKEQRVTVNVIDDTGTYEVSNPEI